MKKIKSEGITVLICLAVIVLVGFLLEKPQLLSLKEKNAQILARQQEISASQQKLSDLRTAASQLKAAEKELELLNLALPSDVGIPEVLVSVEAMVSRAGLTVNSITPASEGEKTTGEVPVSVSASGSFAQLVSFTQILEKNLRPVKIKSIAIAASTAEGQTGVSATYNITLLYQPIGAEVGEGEAAVPEGAAGTTGETGAGAPEATAP